MPMQKIASFQTGRVVSVAYSATITPNFSTTDMLNVGVLTGNLTLANPTGDSTPEDWQSLRISLSSSGSDRTVTLGSNYQIPTSSTIVSPISVAVGTETVLACIYRSSTGKWRIVSLVPGY